MQFAARTEVTGGRCCRPSRREGSSFCQRRPTAISSSTSRATRSGSRRGARILWGIVDTAENVYTVLGARPGAGAAGGRGRDRPDPRAARRAPAITSITTRRTSHRAQAAHLRVRDPRGGAPRPAPRRGLRGSVQGGVPGPAAIERAIRAEVVETFYFDRPADLKAGETRPSLRGLPRATRPTSSTRSPPITRRTASRRSAPRLALTCGRGRPAARGRSRATRRRAPPRPRNSVRRTGRAADDRLRCPRGRAHGVAPGAVLSTPPRGEARVLAVFDRIGRTSRGTSGTRLGRDRRVEPNGGPTGSGIRSSGRSASRRSSTIWRRAIKFSIRRRACQRAGSRS